MNDTSGSVFFMFCRRCHTVTITDRCEKSCNTRAEAVLSLQDGTVRLWNIENMEEIPAVMEKRRTEGTGVHILKVRVKQPFSVRLHTLYLLNVLTETCVSVWGVWKAVPRVQTTDLRAADSVRLLSTQISVQIPTAASTSHVTSATEQQLVGTPHLAPAGSVWWWYFSIKRGQQLKLQLLVYVTVSLKAENKTHDHPKTWRQ